MRPVNVATHPFRNEQGPALAVGAAGVVLLVLTLVHVRVLVGLLHPGGTPLHNRVAALDAESARLRAEAAAIRQVPTPDRGTVAQWAALKELVDRRTFSWSGLLGRLESLLPPEVRLVSIAPTVDRGGIQIQLTAMARPAAAGLALIDTLETQGPFAEVYPVSVADDPTGARFEYTMRYLEHAPRAAPPAVARATRQPPRVEEP